MRARTAVALVSARLAAPVLTRTTPLPRLLDAIDSVAQRFAGSGRDDDARSAVAAVEAVLWRLPRGRGTCLTRALGRALALRLHRVPFVFVLGVRRGTNGGPEAHAWLELAGAPWREDVDVTAFVRSYSRAFDIA
jgi:hypothetical protein